MRDWEGEPVWTGGNILHAKMRMEINLLLSRVSKYNATEVENEWDGERGGCWENGLFFTSSKNKTFWK